MSTWSQVALHYDAAKPTMLELTEKEYLYGKLSSTEEERYRDAAAVDKVVGPHIDKVRLLARVEKRRRLSTIGYHVPSPAAILKSEVVRAVIEVAMGKEMPIRCFMFEDPIKTGLEAKQMKLSRDLTDPEVVRRLMSQRESEDEAKEFLERFGVEKKLIDTVLKMAKSIVSPQIVAVRSKGGLGDASYSNTTLNPFSNTTVTAFSQDQNIAIKSVKRKTLRILVHLIMKGNKRFDAYKMKINARWGVQPLISRL